MLLSPAQENTSNANNVTKDYVKPPPKPDDYGVSNPYRQKVVG